jgi:hypothetical protein
MRNSLFLALLFLLAGCAAKPPPLPPNPAIPFNEVVGKFNLIVEQPTVVATLEYDLAQQLCPEQINCHGRHWSYEVPANGRRSASSMNVSVGPKIIPGLLPEALAGDFAGVLQGYKNVGEVRIDDGRSTSFTRRAHSTPTYLIAATVTEIAWHGERSVNGLGSTMAGNILVIPNFLRSRVANSLGYARVDITLKDVSTGEIVAAFPAAGSYRGEYLTDSPFNFSSDIPKGFGSLMIRSAVHLAFQDATNRLAERLAGRHVGTGSDS